MKTTLLVDADGVLFDLKNPARRLMVEEGIPLQDDDVNFCPKGHWEAFARAVDRRPGWVSDLPAFPFVREVLEEFRALDLDVLCVTRVLHGCVRWHSERASALEALGFKPGEMYFCSDKSRIPGHVFVDDDPDHIRKWQLSHLSSIAVLWDYPSTRQEPIHHNSIRTSDWNHVMTAARAFLAYHEGAR